MAEEGFIDVAGTGQKLDTVTLDQTVSKEEVHREVTVLGSPTDFDVRQEVDAISEGAVIIDSEHYHVHMGKAYHTSHFVAALGAGAGNAHNILLKNPAGNYPHLRSYHAVGTGGPLHIQLFEGTTVSVDGTPLAAHNMNRNASNPASLTVFHTPTITDAGVEMEFHLAPTGHKEGGLTDTVPVEWILKPATNYLIRLTNGNAQAIEALLEAFWYEA